MSNLIGRYWWSLLRHLTPTQRSQAIQSFYQQGSITDWQLWEVLSNHQSPITYVEATQIYHNLGFKPHAGYPLTRQDPFPCVTWETVDLVAYCEGHQASRLHDSDPSQCLNPYEPRTIAWQSWNWGWNSHYANSEDDTGGAL
jgi:hypothetical protein